MLKSVGLEGRPQIFGIGNGAHFLDIVAGLALFLDHRRGDDLDIAEKPARRLLGSNPLGEFAGPQIEALHLDPVLFLEGFQNRQIVRRAQRHAVDDDLAFLLRGCDNGIPGRILRRRRNGETGQ